MPKKYTTVRVTRETWEKISSKRKAGECNGDVVARAFRVGGKPCQ